MRIVHYFIFTQEEIRAIIIAHARQYGDSRIPNDACIENLSKEQIQIRWDEEKS